MSQLRVGHDRKWEPEERGHHEVTGRYEPAKLQLDRTRDKTVLSHELDIIWNDHRLHTRNTGPAPNLSPRRPDTTETKTTDRWKKSCCGQPLPHGARCSRDGHLIKLPPARQACRETPSGATALQLGMTLQERIPKRQTLASLPPDSIGPGWPSRISQTTPSTNGITSTSSGA